jgi:5-methylcytosine-specific restriction protein A
MQTEVNPMPDAPLRVCSAPGCPELTRGGPCPRHQAEIHRRVDQQRGTPAQRGYDAAWRRKRAWVLSRVSSARRDPDGVIRGHGPLCVFCKVERQRVTRATEVDHIDGDPRNNADENLRSTCRICHSRRTAIDQGFARRGGAESSTS